MGASEKPLTEPWVILESKVNGALLGLELVGMERSFLEEVLANPEYQGPKQTFRTNLQG